MTTATIKNEIQRLTRKLRLSSTYERDLAVTIPESLDIHQGATITFEQNRAVAIYSVQKVEPAEDGKTLVKLKMLNLHKTR